MIRTLEITVKGQCPLQCGFCPQSTLKAAYGVRPMFDTGDFHKCLSTVPESVRVDFSGYCEPMIHPNIAEMIRWAREAGHEVHLYTTLVGLTDSKMSYIFMYPPHYIRIHCPDAQALRVHDSRWIKLHKIFAGTGIPATYMAMGPMTPGLTSYFASNGINVELPQMLSRGGNLPNVPAPKITGRIRCAADRWHQNVLLPNGDVQACCMDYGLTMTLGNLMRQPYDEIEQRANQFEANKNPPENSICRSCEWATQI